MPGQFNKKRDHEERKCQSDGTTYVGIGTATVGGAWYSMGGALANVLSKNMPNVKANAAPTGASIENLESIRQGKMEIGFATTDIPYSMYRGVNNLAENKSFRALLNNDLIYLAVIVLEKSPIKKFTGYQGQKAGDRRAGELQLHHRRGGPQGPRDDL